MSFLVFVAPPFAGHLNPLTPLAEAARDAGHRIEILTGLAKIETLQRADLSAASLECLGPKALEAIADPAQRVGSDLFQLAAQMRQALALIGPARDEMIARWRDDRPDLIVADYTAIPAGLAAQALGIPWISTVRPPFVLETGEGPPSYLGGWSPMAGALGRLRDAAGWALVRTGKNALAAVFRKELARVGLKRLRPDGSEAIYSPLALLSTTMRELEFTQAWPKHLRFLGPGSENPEHVGPLDLPPQCPRVLVTYGTHIPWAKRTLAQETAALAARVPEASFVVALGDAARASPQPIEIIDGRVSVFAFVPYVAELPHFDAVIHHGGAGIVFAAIEAAKPSLVCPQDYDQFDYAARLEHFGLGRRFKRIGSEDAAMKLRALLAAPPPALTAFSAAARAYRPRETFLAIVREILETGRLA